MNHRRRLLSPRFRLFLIGLVTMLVSSRAMAGYSGDWYWIERPRLALDVEYRFEWERWKAPSANTKSVMHAVTETFDVATKGWLYHPALLDYAIQLSPGFEQTFETPNPGRDRDTNAFLLGYDIDLMFLPDKPYTLNLFARREHSEVDTSNVNISRSRTDSDAYGATLMLKYRVLPTTVSYLHGIVDQSGYYDSEEDRDEVRLRSRHESKASDTRLDATYTKLDRTQLSSKITTDNAYGGAYNLYRVTDDRRVLLNSGLNYRWSQSSVSDSSTYDSSLVSLSEDLTWTHTPTFNTRYNFMYSGTTSEGPRIDTTSGSIGLVHTLYENLTTSLSAIGAYSEPGESYYGPNLNLAYQRSIPWGTLYASTGHSYIVNVHSTNAEDVPVIDESHVLRVGEVELLVNRNVDVTSIVVASADRTVIYQEEMDYRIELVGSYVRISRTPFGDIDEGNAVLVSYVYESDPAWNDGTYRQSYGAGLYLWSAWRINYRYFDSHQGFLSGTRPDVLIDTTEHNLDTDLQWRWSTTQLTLQDSDTTSGTSLRRWRASENLMFRPLRNLTFGISGYGGQSELKDIGSTEDFYGGSSRLRWRLAAWSNMSVEGFYENVDGRSNHTENKGFKIRTELFYHIWRGEISYRFLNQDDLLVDQSRDRHSIFLTIKRALY